jgi:hypothetical protein
MKTVAVIFALAIMTIIFSVYSDASLISADFAHAKAQDAAKVAIGHGAQRK